ncbi:nucleoside triphosphate pyrophosphohydrolase [Tardibacter chloracetimidivorans]
MPDKPTAADLQALCEVMRRLRDPENGCPWDVQQDFASIAPYTIEEAYEVADAIERRDLPALKDELGDLLLQVVYHSQMASEADAFSIDDVISAITHKMIRRHPHVFGEGESAGWENIKAAERASSSQHGALEGVALALPALKRAEKLQKRAARVGFDWPDANGPRDKVLEELQELDEAASHDHRIEEYGDLLFAMVNLGRHLAVDAESALRHANAKFTRRFQAMETLGGDGFADLSLEEKDRLWMEVKVREKRDAI